MTKTLFSECKLGNGLDTIQESKGHGAIARATEA